MDRVYTAIRNAKGFHSDLFNDDVPEMAELLMVYSVLEQLNLIVGIDNVEDYADNKCGGKRNCDDLETFSDAELEDVT